MESTEGAYAAHGTEDKRAFRYATRYLRGNETQYGTVHAIYLPKARGPPDAYNLWATHGGSVLVSTSVRRQ